MTKMIIQIAIVSVTALITLGYTVYTMIDNEAKEKELKQKQEQLTENLMTMKTQQAKDAAKIQEKSDEIIQLQTALHAQSEKQLDELNRLRHPIPISIDFGFLATLDFSELEFNGVKSILNERFPDHVTNLLPFDFNNSNEGFDKINKLRDVHLQLRLVMEEAGKQLIFKFEQQPLLFFGYNSLNMANSTRMFLDNSFGVIRLEGSQLQVTDISTNYAKPSMLDFQHANFKISYEFFYPKQVQVGNRPTNIYFADNREYITFVINSVVLNFKNFSIPINQLQKIDSHTFEGLSSIEL